MYNIAVLLSTYNGEKYLREQIESILYQKDVQIHLFIRDDGSSDNTVIILKEYKEKYDNIVLLLEENIGYQKSFFKLVFFAGRYDFYAFADQDDVWKKEKLISAIGKLRNIHEPAMYYSMMTQVDTSLKIISEQQKPIRPLSKEKVLFQNFVQGSTIVFNYKLYCLIIRYYPNFNIAHDIWIPCLATYFGKVIFDFNSYILYRRHDDSVTVKMNKPSYIHRILKKFREKEIVDNLAIYLLKGYKKELNFHDCRRLSYVSNYDKSLINKLKCLFDMKIRKNSLKGTIILKIAFLMNRVERKK